MTEKQLNELKDMYAQATKSFAKSKTSKEVFRAEVITLERVFNTLGIDWTEWDDED